MFGIPKPLLLIAGAGVLLHLWSRAGAARAAIRPAGLTVLLAAAMLYALEVRFGHPESSTATTPLHADRYDGILQGSAVWIACGLGALLLLIDSARQSASAAPLLLAASGVGVVAAGDSVIWLLVGLHLIAFATILLIQTSAGDGVALSRLLLFQATACALFLFGVCLLAVQTDTLSLSSMRMEIQTNTGVADSGNLAVASSVIILAGLLGVTWGAWLPWGAERPATRAGFGVDAAVSVLPATTGLLIMLRLFPGLLTSWDADILTTVTIAALLCMAVGLPAAWLQSRLCGMLGWTLIVHAGMWCGLLAVAGWDTDHPEWSPASASGLPGGYAAVLVAAVCDVLALLGVWSTLSWVAGERDTLRHPDELCGLLRQHRLAGGVLSICLLSLCGTPFLAGFWGRFWSVTAMFGPRQASSLTGLYEPHPGFLFLLAVSAVAHLGLCGMYLRLLERIVLEHPLGRIRPAGRHSAIVCATLLAGATVIFGVWPQPLIQAVSPGTTPDNPATLSPPAAGIRTPPSPADEVGGTAVRGANAPDIPMHLFDDAGQGRTRAVGFSTQPAGR